PIPRDERVEAPLHAERALAEQEGQVEREERGPPRRPAGEGAVAEEEQLGERVAAARDLHPERHAEAGSTSPGPAHPGPARRKGAAAGLARRPRARRSAGADVHAPRFHFFLDRAARAPAADAGGTSRRIPVSSQPRPRAPVRRLHPFPPWPAR